MAITDTLYRLTLMGEHLGNRTQNQFWFTDRNTSLQDSEAESLVSLMNSFNDWVLPAWVQFCSSSWHALGLIGEVMNKNPRWMISSGYETTTGAQDADSLPADRAGVVAVVGGIAGRSHRGRIYVPAIAKTLTDGDYLTGGGAGLLADIANALKSRFATTGSSLNHLYVVFSRKNGAVRVPGPPPHYEYSIDGITAVETLVRRTLICGMRRRRPDHGI